jgi:excisionase family DNA binding protein
MATFLSTQEMQDLIGVDRSTIYRMAEDGRLPAVKVGRQWRFPADRVAAQLGLDPPRLTQPPGATAASAAQPAGRDRLGDLLAPETLQPLAALLGDLFEVMAVVTDMDGTALTQVANQCGFYRSVADRPEAASACARGWRELASQPTMTPRFVESHFGFLCARTFVWVEMRPVGMIVVGGVTPPSWPPPMTRLTAISAEVGVEAEVLAAVVDQTWDVAPERQEWILRLLPRVGDLISQLASARSQLIVRLDEIAQLAGSAAPHRREAS